VSKRVTYDKSWDVKERPLELNLHMRSSGQADMADDLIELALAVRSGAFPPDRWRASNCPHDAQITSFQSYDQQSAQEGHDRRLAELAEDFKKSRNSQ